MPKFFPGSKVVQSKLASAVNIFTVAVRDFKAVGPWSQWVTALVY